MGNPPYGYRADPQDKNHWILDEDAAPVVKRIFDLIGKYASLKVEQIAEQIKKGDISVNPGTDGVRSACDFCSYSHVCGFEKRIPGYEERDMKLSEEEAYEAMGRAVEEAEKAGKSMPEEETVKTGITIPGEKTEGLSVEKDEKESGEKKDRSLPLLPLPSAPVV